MNDVKLAGKIRNVSALCYTPAGLAVLTFDLYHHQVKKLGQQNQVVTLSMMVIAFGELAVALASCLLPKDPTLEWHGEFKGFLVPVKKDSKILRMQLTQFRHLESIKVLEGK